MSQSQHTRPQMNLRISAGDRELIDRSAEALGTSRSEFMLTASRKMAEATLMNRVLFPIDDETWDAFIAALDSASPTNQAGVDKLKNATLPWAN